MLFHGKPISPQVLGRIASLGELFGRYPVVRLAYVFGSAATGRMTRLSDIDIAVLLDPGLTRDAVSSCQLALIGEIADTLGTDGFDLVILNQVPLTLKSQVVRSGRIIYAKDEKDRIDFEASIRDQYLDFAPLRDEYYRTFYKNIMEGRMLGDRRNKGTEASQQSTELPG